jgi:hypothetical protein
MLSPTQAREAVHVLLLRELQEVKDARAVILKGGVNLRLFHGSPRYSEDMDLDGDPEARLAIRSTVRGIFDNREFARSLTRVGLRGVDPKEGPNKDTETTFRYKFHVLAPGNQSYGTKVEVSFRPRNESDSHELAEPDPERVARYLPSEEHLIVQRYGRDAALRQKIEALAGRTRIEARDIFDIHMLLAAQDSREPALLDFLAENIDSRTLSLAYERALELNYREYESLVVRFLENEAREEYRSPERWDVLRLETAALIEDVQARKQGNQ